VERLFDDLLSKPNARDRVRGNLGDGSFVYEGAHAVDDSGITAWRFTIYESLVPVKIHPYPRPWGLRSLLLPGHRM